MCISLSMLLHSGVGYFLKLPVDELFAIAQEVTEVNGK